MDAPTPNRETIRKVMQGNRGRDTKPELAVRRLVHARGLRYRVNARVEPDLRRTADLLFARRRIAVFVDGCYWHGCPEHFQPPKSNTEFWTSKIDRNRDRDAQTNDVLRRRGWTVLRFWTHEPATAVADVIETAVRASS
jgi:DNA mismatch endonuclease (patch repair protein)